MSTSTKQLINFMHAELDGKMIDVRFGEGWRAKKIGAWDSDREYRFKPIPREWWANVYSGGDGTIHTTKEAATGTALMNGVEETIKVREILDNED